LLAARGAPPAERGFTAASATRALAALVAAALPHTVVVDTDAAPAEARRAVASERAARFRAHGRLLAGALRADWALSDAFFFAGAVTLPDALATAQEKRAASEVSRVVIREHHQTLRVAVAQAAAAATAAALAAPPPPPLHAAACDDDDLDPDGPQPPPRGDAAAAARAAAWAAAVAGGDALDEYAVAATETGRRGWVRAAQRWCHDATRDFFHAGGAPRAALRAAKRAHFSAHGAAMSDDAAAATLAAAQAALDAAVGRHAHSAAAPPPRLRLLDVGSCHDPWRVHDDEFEARACGRMSSASRLGVVRCTCMHPLYPRSLSHARARAQVTALDLRPAVDSVWRSDILALRIGPPGSAPVSDPPCAPGDGAGVLRQLPRGGFHVVVLSLVLSYIPDPLARTQARAAAAHALRHSVRKVHRASGAHACARAKPGHRRRAGAAARRRRAAAHRHAAVNRPVRESKTHTHKNTHMRASQDACCTYRAPYTHARTTPAAASPGASGRTARCR
jgi:hypothetical protein